MGRRRPQIRILQIVALVGRNLLQTDRRRRLVTTPDFNFHWSQWHWSQHGNSNLEEQFWSDASVFWLGEGNPRFSRFSLPCFAKPDGCWQDSSTFSFVWWLQRSQHIVLHEANFRHENGKTETMHELMSSVTAHCCVLCHHHFLSLERITTCESFNGSRIRMTQWKRVVRLETSNVIQMNLGHPRIHPKFPESRKQDLPSCLPKCANKSQTKQKCYVLCEHNPSWHDVSLFESQQIACSDLETGPWGQISYSDPKGQVDRVVYLVQEE